MDGANMTGRRLAIEFLERRLNLSGSDFLSDYIDPDQLGVEKGRVEKGTFWFKSNQNVLFSDPC
jgi:hypothetical protein